MKKFIFSEVSFFQPELFQRLCLEFKWLHSRFGIQSTPFTDTSHSEAAIRNLGKILKNQLRRISFLNLMKLNASNCHLLKMNSIRGFSRTLPKFYTIRYGLFEFSVYLFQKTPTDGCFYTFRSTCFSEHLKVDVLFIKQPSYFLLAIFLFKESPKKHITSFSLA